MLQRYARPMYTAYIGITITVLLTLLAVPSGESLDMIFEVGRMGMAGVLLYIWYLQWHAMRDDQETWHTLYRESIDHANAKHGESVEIAQELHKHALSEIRHATTEARERHQRMMERVLNNMNEVAETNRAVNGALNRLEQRLDNYEINDPAAQ